MGPQDFQQKPQPRNLRHGQAGVQTNAVKQKFLYPFLSRKKKQITKVEIITSHAINN